MGSSKIAARRTAFLHLALFALTYFLVPTAIEIACVATTLGLLSAALARKHDRQQAASAVSFFFFGFLVMSLAHVLLYQKVTGLAFDLLLVAHSPVESFEIAIMYLGSVGAVVFVSEYILLSAVIGMAIRRLISRWPVTRMKFLKRSLPRALALLAFTAAAALYLREIGEVAQNLTVTEDQIASRAKWEGPAGITPKPGESLILLQLESVNGNAIFDQRTGKPRIELPAFERLAREGATWFPEFWGNAYGTHLGMLSILCGTSGHIGNTVITPPAGFDCLPARFRNAGFKTAFYYSFNDPRFFRVSAVVDKLGFDDFIYGSKIMKPEDPFLHWGYQDCRFYDRAFEHLKNSGLGAAKNAFIYMSVHMNHMPFKPHLGIPLPLKEDENPRAAYLNSVYEQDHCLGKFLDHVESLKRDDLHLIVVGDHSVAPWKVEGPHEQFVTSFIYLPAKSRRSEFKPGPVIGIRPAQDQILSTVLEIFGNSFSRSSFLWAMKGEPQPSSYRTCHLVADAAPRFLLAVQGDEAVRLSMRNQRYQHFTFASDQPAQTEELRTKMSWNAVNVVPACLSQIGISR